jgi:integrase
MPRRRGNGEGSISRRKDGLWMARYYVDTPKGRKRKAVYGKTREEVRDKMAKALADRADGLVFDDENLTVGEYLDSWLKGSVRGSVRQSTYDRYRVDRDEWGSTTWSSSPGVVTAGCDDAAPGSVQA